MHNKYSVHAQVHVGKWMDENKAKNYFLMGLFIYLFYALIQLTFCASRFYN